MKWVMISAQTPNAGYLAVCLCACLSGHPEESVSQSVSQATEVVINTWCTGCSSLQTNPSPRGHPDSGPALRSILLQSYRLHRVKGNLHWGFRG